MPLVNEKKSIRTSSDNFSYMVKASLLVDKSLMIKEFWEGEQVSLITRPRRFGKTLNLSMLQHFFAATVNGEETTGLFNSLAIAAEKDEEGKSYIKEHQGKYPVIFISFKDVKGDLSPSKMALSKEKRAGIAYTNAILNIKFLIQKLYREHAAILKSDRLVDSQKFRKYLEATVETEELKEALAFLSECLHVVYQKKVIILIDEYDSPLTKAYSQGSSEALSEFFRDLFGAALKTNGHLEKGLMTGILRVSKNSMLSGLNNLKTYTLLDKRYKDYFGFTEDEVQALMQVRSVPHTLEEIKSFYNGYKIGGVVIYNPWSVMQFLDQEELAPYWVLTSNDKLLKDILLKSNEETKSLLGELMQGKAITGEIEVNLRYEDLIEKPTALWTLLLFCGYLTVESSRLSPIGTARICQLRIPNQEVLCQYTQVFNEWLKEKVGNTQYDSFLRSLVDGRVEEFTKSLTGYLFSCTSSHDFQAESDYHSFMLGLLVSIKETHFLYSNKEAAAGRPDCLLIPKDLVREQGIILEFKHIHFKNKDLNKDVENLKKTSHLYAEDGLNQITKRGYSYGFVQHPQIKSVLKVGIAFSNRIVSSAYKVIEIENGEKKVVQPESPIEFFDADETEYPKVKIFESKGESKPKNKKRSRVIEESDEEIFVDEKSSKSKISKGLRPFSSRSDSIQDTHWYVEDEVNTLLQHHFQKNAEVELLTAMLGTDWKVGNTLTAQLGQFNEQRQNSLTAGHTVKNKIVIPINLGDYDGNGIHWVLLLIKFPDGMLQESQQILYFDPFGNPIPEDVSNSLMEANIYENNDQIICSNVKLQDDGYNCGPWIVAIADYLVTQEEAAQRSGIPFDMSNTLLHLEELLINRIRHQQLQILNPQNSENIQEPLLSAQTNFFQSSVYRPDFNNPEELQKQIQTFEEGSKKKSQSSKSYLDTGMDIDEEVYELESDEEPVSDTEDNPETTADSPQSSPRP